MDKNKNTRSRKIAEIICSDQYSDISQSLNSSFLSGIYVGLVPFWLLVGGWIPGSLFLLASLVFFFGAKKRGLGTLFKGIGE